ncbi:MAG TPA: hypothetical protein DD650_04225 [Ruminococcaceae bacterium]|nr:hypothetical protein [Oscillospiraceae bacterium]
MYHKLSKRLHNFSEVFELKGKISMVEIAEMSGVSIATVSRVLNHNGRFSSETERKVMNIVNK